MFGSRFDRIAIMVVLNKSSLIVGQIDKIQRRKFADREQTCEHVRKMSVSHMRCFIFDSYCICKQDIYEP